MKHLRCSALQMEKYRIGLKIQNPYAWETGEIATYDNVDSAQRHSSDKHIAYGKWKTPYSTRVIILPFYCT